MTAPGPACADGSDLIGIADFQRVDIRAGTIIRAEPFAQARRPAIRLWIDFGALGLRKSSAQITDHYSPDTLPGRQVLAVVNFPPRQIGPFMSEVLVLGLTAPDGGITLITPDQPVTNGEKLH
ncbi:tRNA-binding protein [Paracoccus jiaweipingae]|uniref:tRNA-binding protein n=1 Tax=unclassified Paracoccus (in: a-proteobacteria) TaxID=2688777 RepID=UPI0037A9F754